MSLEIGQTVGDYQVVGVLGQGGMGSVYRVRNTLSERIEAMKVLLPNLRDVPELADRFLREIKVQAKLDHPNITALRTAFRDSNQLLMVMELVDGVSLDKIRAERQLTADEVTAYARQALEALSYAHSMGVIHRDLKPANMMLTTRGQIKLTDFGIAHDSADRKLTRTGVALGSLYYISPEQVQGKVPDARSDVYSLGITLYELLTGELPFKCDTDYAMMTAHLMQMPEPPVSRKPTIPSWLSDVVMKSIAKEPAQRFQSAAEFSSALGAGRSMTDPTVAIPAIVAAPAGGRSKIYVAGGVAAVVIAAVAAIGLRSPAPQAPSTASTPIAASTASAPVSQSAPNPSGSSAPATVATPSPASSTASPATATPATAIPTTLQKTPVQAAAIPAAPAPRSDAARSAGSKPQVEAPSSVPASPLNVAQVQSTPLQSAPAYSPAAAAPPPTVNTPAPSQAVVAPKAKDPRLEEWERLSGSSDVGALEAFRKRAADQYAQLAERRIEDVEWGSVQGSRDPIRLRAFRDRHPRSAYAARAAADADRIERESSGRAIQDALNRYKAAFESRNIAAVRAVWPGLAGNQAQAIENGFKNSKSIQMTLAAVGEPQIQGNSATVTCSRKQVIQTKSGPPLTPEHTVTFHLRKTGDGWMIESIQ